MCLPFCTVTVTLNFGQFLVLRSQLRGVAALRARRVRGHPARVRNHLMTTLLSPAAKSLHTPSLWDPNGGMVVSSTHWRARRIFALWTPPRAHAQRRSEFRTKLCEWVVCGRLLVGGHPFMLNLGALFSRPTNRVLFRALRAHLAARRRFAASVPDDKFGAYITRSFWSLARHDEGVWWAQVTEE